MAFAGFFVAVVEVQSDDNGRKDPEGNANFVVLAVVVQQGVEVVGTQAK